LSTVSSAAIAPGYVTVEGSRKAIQHRDGGPVAAVLVTEGDYVEAGQVLVSLDLSDVRAEVEGLSTLRVQLMVRLARLRAEAADAETLVFPTGLLALADDARFAALFEQERSLFEARRTAYVGNVGLLRQSIEGYRRQIGGLQGQIRSTRTQVALIQDELDGVMELLVKGLVQRPRALALERSAAALRGDLEGLTATVATAENEIRAAELKIAQIEKDRREEVAADLSTAEAQLAELEPRLAAAQDKLSRADLVAPEAGYVHGLAVHAAGAAIVPGQTVLEIVPAGEPLVVTAEVDPRDVERVRPGQDVEVHLTAFRQRYQSIIGGRVLKVSADRFQDELQRRSWFKVTVEVDAEDLRRADIELVPGMSAQAVIKTGDRTVLAYLLDPILHFYDFAMKEE
jgi:HlyD family type I secretion membrane fusion protein